MNNGKAGHMLGFFVVLSALNSLMYLLTARIVPAAYVQKNC